MVKQLDIKPLEREVFFNRYWLKLEEKGWPAVILHSWKNLPERIESDVDYAVSGVAIQDLIILLSKYAKEQGWRLAQVIEHEPGACYCVCIQMGGAFDSIALDVTSDYRRLGHHFISAKRLTDGMRKVQGKSFFVPKPGIELCYLLAKGAAKGKPFSELSERLVELLEEDKASCLSELKEVFPKDTTSLYAEKLNQSYLEKWYKTTDYFLPVRSGRKFGWDEILLYCRRIIKPTGLWITVPEETPDRTIKNISSRLTPLFRSVYQCENMSVFNYIRLIPKLVRSTLIIEKKAIKKRGYSLTNTRLYLEKIEKYSLVKIIETLSTRINKTIQKNLI